MDGRARAGVNCDGVGKNSMPKAIELTLIPTNHDISIRFNDHISSKGWWWAKTISMAIP